MLAAFLHASILAPHGVVNLKSAELFESVCADFVKMLQAPQSSA
jgi:hypothetical protein